MNNVDQVRRRRRKRLMNRISRIFGATSPAFVTTFSQVMSGNSDLWSGYNMRQVIDASLISTTGTQVRVSLLAGTTTGCTIDSIYIGHQAGAGDVYDFDGGQVQLKYRAAGSFSIAAAETIITDARAFALDETKNLIISAHFSGVSSISEASIVGCTRCYLLGADETSTTDVTGYNTASGAGKLSLVKKIEVVV